MTKQLRVRHSNKEYVRWKEPTARVVTRGSGDDEIHGLGGADDIRGGDGNDWIDLKRSAVAYAKTYGLGSSLFWWARNIANDPIVPWDFKSLSKHGARSAVWTSA